MYLYNVIKKRNLTHLKKINIMKANKFFYFQGTIAGRTLFCFKFESMYSVGGHTIFENGNTSLTINYDIDGVNSWIE